MSSGIRRIWLAVACSLFVLLAGHLGNSAADSPKRKLVQLTIDFGDGFQKRYTSIPWKPKMTVADATNFATKHKRGIKTKIRGRGATAFLTQIDDLKNQGRGLNWIYRVNGKLGNRSFGVYRVKAGDRILWKFGKYR